MREIKFRVWDEKRKRFHYWGFWVNKFSGSKSFSYIPSGIPVDKIEKLSEQFTGVKDINGKEVYEGDIISYKADKEGSTGIVKFINGCFMIVWENGSLYRSEIMTPLCYISCSKEIEIIGNIHE